MIELRELLLLAMAVGVPLGLIVMRRDRALLAWICITVSVDIFNTQIFVNLPAARLTGLLLLPRAIALLPRVVLTRPGKALVLHYLYLLLLGLTFGFLLPWPGGGLARSFNQLAPGRAVIYVIRSAGDLGVAFFVARQVVRRERVEEVLRLLLLGTSIAACGAVLELVTRLDLYNLITGLRPLSLPLRMRGLNYEPRGLGLIAAHGLVLALLWLAQRRSLRGLALVGLHAFAVGLAGSTSAAIAAGAGSVALFAFSRRSRPVLIGLAAAGSLVLVLLVGTTSRYLSSFIENARVRLTVDRIERAPETMVENLAFRMDIFDGPAVLFLSSHPAFLVTGTGPGLISLPATAYIPPSPDFSWAAEEGINSVPTAGIVLELANAGLIGLTLWFIVVLSSLWAFRDLDKERRSMVSTWAMGSGAFAAAAAIYLSQASALSAIWSVFVGIGLAAAFLTAGWRRSPEAAQSLAAQHLPTAQIA